MTYLGKTQLIAIFIVPPDQVAEGDRIFKSHRAWMEATHYREGEKALLSYTCPRVRSSRTRWIPTPPQPATCVSS